MMSKKSTKYFWVFFNQNRYEFAWGIIFIVLSSYIVADASTPYIKLKYFSIKKAPIIFRILGWKNSQKEIGLSYKDSIYVLWQPSEYNQITSKGLRSLRKSNFHCLILLNFEDNLIGNEGLLELSKFKCKQLQNLSLCLHFFT